MGPGDAFASRNLSGSTSEDKEEGPGDSFSALGLAEAVGTFIPKMFAGGLGGAAQALGAKLGGATNEETAGEFMSGFEKAQEPSFFTPKATEYQQKGMEALGKVTDAAGRAVAKLAEFADTSPSLLDSRPIKEQMKRFEERGMTSHPLAQGVGEVGANLYLGKKIGDATTKILSRSPKAAEPIPEKVPQAMGPGDAWKADMLGIEQVPTKAPNSPYNLTPEQIKAGETDMRETAAEAGRYRQDQGDLFQTPQEDLQRRLSQGSVGARDKSDQAFVPSDREGNVPGVYPETQPRGEFQSREPARNGEPASIDVASQSESAQKFVTPKLEKGERGNIEYLTAKEYGDLVGPFNKGVADQRKRIDKEHGKMAKGEKLEVPWIELDREGKVTDHDGHHRAKAIEERFGPDAKIPVKVLGKDVGDFAPKSGIDIQENLLSSSEQKELDTVSKTEARSEDLKNPYPGSKGQIPNIADKGSKATYLTARDYYDWLMKTENATPIEKALLRMLKRTNAFASLEVSLEHSKDTYTEKANAAGAYHPIDHSIEMGRHQWTNTKTAIHEGWHAVTYDYLRRFPNSGITRGAQAVYNWTLKNLSEDVKAQFPFLKHSATDALVNSATAKDVPGKAYGLADMHEFLSEAGSNRTFQKLLSTIETTPEQREYLRSVLQPNRGPIATMWDAFKNIFKGIWEKSTGQKMEGTMLDAAFDVLATAAGAKNGKYDSGGLVPNFERFSPTAERFNDAKSYPVEGLFDKQDHLTVMKEAARDFALDKRPIEQVIDENLKGVKLQDFQDKDKATVSRLWDRTQALVKENLLQDTTIKVLTKNRPGTGPLIKWAVDQVSRIERESITRTKEMLSASLYPFRKEVWSKQGRGDMIAAWKVWRENIGVKDLQRIDFNTDRGYRAYAAFQKVTDQILNLVNDKRTEAGFKPIERIPSFFHAGWQGDYRVFAYDAAGAKKWASGHTTEFEAESFKKDFEKKHPDLRVEWQHKETDKYGIKDLSAFEDAVRVMGKDDPITTALLKTAHEISSKRGFGRTGVYRTGVAGWLGSKDGFIGIKEMEQSFEQYVNSANRYVANLEKQKVRADFFKIPNEMRTQIPETMDFLHEYIDKAHGKIYFDAIDSVFSDVMKAAGFGANAPMKIIHGMSQWASLVWLTTPRFLLSQTVQSMNAIPKLVQEHGVVNGNKAWWDGVSNAIMPDAVAKTAVDWASKRGYLDPTIRNMVGRGINEAPVGSISELIREAAALPATAAEHYMVRLPAFLAFEKALRSLIKDPEKRFSEAAEKADYYMVNYGRTHSAMIYDKIGLFGEAARPLKQYSHQAIGSFLEYAADAKGGNVAPLAHFLGVQALVGGLKGVMFVAEATAAITLINYLFDTDIDTPERLLMKSHLPDTAVYGVASTAIGHDISSSVSAPGLKSMLSFPPIEFTAGMIHDVGIYLIHKAQGIDNAQDRLKAAIAITPNFAHEALRNLWTPEGQPTANPNDSQLRGNYARSNSERIWASLVGAKPINEAKADMLIRNVKQVLSRDAERKMDSLDAIADSVQGGNGISKDLIDRFLRDGGDPSRLSQMIKKRIEDRLLTGEQRIERDSSGSMTLEKRHRLETLMQNMPEQNPSAPLGFDPKSGRLLQLGPDGDIEKISKTSGKKQAQQSTNDGALDSVPIKDRSAYLNDRMPKPSMKNFAETMPIITPNPNSSTSDTPSYRKSRGQFPGTY